MRKFIAFLLMVVPVCIATPVFGANVTVTGTVVCEDGKGQNEPCEMLTIQEFEGEKALTNSAVTDLAGKFSLKVKVGNRIKFTYVGMEDKWIDVKAGVTDLGTIEMKTSSQNLSEVMVVECSMKDAKELGIKARDKYNDCVPTACIEPRWKLKGEGKKAKCEEQKCKIENGTGEWVKDGDSWACKVKSCKKGYDKTDDQTGCREMLKKCTDAQVKEHPNATKTGIKKGTEICIAQDCKCGFELKDEKCVAWPENKECTADTKPRLPDDAASAKMVCENDKAVCKIDKCVSDDYELKDNKCESKNKQPCTPEDKNATAGEYKKRDGKLVCVITSCKENYSVDKDNNKCVAGMVLSEEDQKARIAELEENAKKMKDKEQSMENKLLGAAGMGMTGAGLSKSLSAGAEQ
ncbi:MAG: hypothetical protein IJY99_00475, partial [Alphaproteobacteria bacterium]|nr:hypothetical protein [Alphaproteobacteria bacterium]